MTQISTPTPTQRCQSLPRIGWLSAGVALVSFIWVAAVPTPADAQQLPGSLHCCCDIDRSRCADSPIVRGQAGADGYPKSPFCPPTDQLELTEYESAVQGPGFDSCNAFVNPSGADFKAAAEEKARTRTWVSRVLCPTGPGTNCELIPDNCRVGDQKDKPCTILDLVVLLVNISKLMLAVLGSAAFLMFIYGGFVWLTSAGSPEAVNKGKTILRNAVLGILVVLVSWTAVNLVVAALTAGRGGIGSVANVFNQQWNRGP